MTTSITLNEEISGPKIDKVARIIVAYLRKKLKLKDLFAMPAAEEWKNSKGHGFGIRLFSPKTGKSLRLNWQNAGTVGFFNVKSADYWDGKEKAPYHIEFSSLIALVKVIPAIAEFILSGAKDKIISVGSKSTDLSESLNESLTLMESNFDPDRMFARILEIATQEKFNKGAINREFKRPGIDVFEVMAEMFPTAINRNGNRFGWFGTPDDTKAIRAAKDEILRRAQIETGVVSRGPAKESYAIDPEVEAMENDRERLTYEQQLSDLEDLIRLTVSGSSNALFVAGRGGIGKTTTVEKVLNELGKTDGDGYFLNAGSATAAGLYRLFAKYRDTIILFDDSDSALADQEARNLLKGATDTKRVRKLVWSKAGKNIVDPKDFDDDIDEILDQDLLPAYFEFTGRVIFISNLKIDKLDPDGALRTRAFMISIDPTDVEVYDFMGKIVGNMKIEGDLELSIDDRQHVVDLLRNSKNSKQTANLRKLSRGLAMKAGSIRAGVNVSDAELARMISTYA